MANALDDLFDDDTPEADEPAPPPKRSPAKDAVQVARQNLQARRANPPEADDIIEEELRTAAPTLVDAVEPGDLDDEDEPAPPPPKRGPGRPPNPTPPTNSANPLVRRPRVVQPPAEDKRDTEAAPPPALESKPASVAAAVNTLREYMAAIGLDEITLRRK